MSNLNSPLLDDDDLLDDLLLDDTPQNAPRGTNIEQLPGLPLQLTVELARVALPLAELQQLAVGHVLVLPEQTQPQMILRVNGEAIGEGELGQHEGQLNLRLTELTPSIVAGE